MRESKQRFCLEGGGHGWNQVPWRCRGLVQLCTYDLDSSSMPRPERPHRGLEGHSLLPFSCFPHPCDAVGLPSCVRGWYEHQCPMGCVVSLVFILGLGYSMRDLCCSMWGLLSRCTNSLIVSRRLSVRAGLLLGVWNLCSPARARTCVLCIARRILNH